MIKTLDLEKVQYICGHKKLATRLSVDFLKKEEGTCKSIQVLKSSQSLHVSIKRHDLICSCSLLCLNYISFDMYCILLTCC